MTRKFTYQEIKEIIANPTGYEYGKVIDAFMDIAELLDKTHVDLNKAKDLAHKWRAEASNPSGYAPDFEYAFPWETQQASAANE